MAVAPFEIIAGPANVWIAPTGTAFPAVNAAPGGGWTALGYTDGGITVTHEQDITQLMVDQLTIPVKTIRTTEGITVEFSLAQLTLERYLYAINAPTVVTTAGPPATKEIPLQQGDVVRTRALLVRGPSPYGDWNMQYELPVVYQAENPSVTFTRDDKAVLATSFTALADTGAAPGSQFGRLIAQSA